MLPAYKWSTIHEMRSTLASQATMASVSSIKSKVVGWLFYYIARTLSVGPIPKHIAIILDGNRRWAKKRGLKPMEGHSQGVIGAHAIAEFLEALGIKEITAYGFSIENFNRPKEEVDYLMKKMHENADEQLEGVKNGRLLRLIGDKSLLSEELQVKINKIEENTKNNKGIIANGAIAYTCRDDIVQGMRKVLNSDVKTEDITVELLSNHMYTQPLSDVDILVRTSGETRFSDFLMWEVSKLF